MTDWTSGYVADVGYTFGYYSELNPARVRLAFLNAGLVFPEISSACELGFGQGMSAAIHAAASESRWYGTDFNPGQASFAQEISKASGAETNFYDEAFAEFCARTDLPDFDFIALHGIWSWISDQNRHAIVDFVRRKLKVGGVLYISYNTMPGWANFAPMRHLMTQHAEILGAEGRGIVSRIEGALDFAQKLLGTKPGYAGANPQVEDRLSKLLKQNRHYLAHEYFNRDWHPMHFATMAEWLAPSKVSFACSAHYLDHIDAVNLTAPQQQFLKEIPDTMLRQSVRDFMVNAQFRRDYWVKGPRQMGGFERRELLQETGVVLITHRPDVPMKTTASLGEVSLIESVYTPVLDALAKHEVKTVSQLHSELKGKGLELPQLLQALMVLVGSGHAAQVQPGQGSARVKKQCDSLNANLANKARSMNDVNTLASPLTGGGVTVGRFQQLFIQAIKQGKKQPEEWASHVWGILAAQGQKLIKDGKPIESVEDNIAELRAQAQEFAEKRLTALKALKVL